MFKKSFFERNPKKTLLIFISIAIVIIDLSFKGILNLYNAIFYNDSIKDIVISHESYHHTFKPNTKVKVHSENGNYTITTNSLGFKDDKVRDIKKNIDKDRIILIGDSFTEGVLLDFEKTFAGIFKNYLANQNIDLLNAGRGGYSPIIYWAKIKHLIEIEKLKFNELYVFIDLSDTWDEYYMFDLDENQNVKLKNPNNSNQNITENLVGKIKVKLKENTFLTYLVLNYLNDFFKNNDEDKIWYSSIVNGVHFDKWPIDKSSYDDWGKEGLKLQIQYMNKLKNLLDENDIDLTVVVYPWISQIWYEDLNSLQVKIWQDWSKKNSTNFINLFPLFVKKNISDSEKDKIINDNFIKGDFHFNEKGNIIIAEELIDKFENK
tara:strand:- start:2623 stop:3753 length:1131 start_codon:yes stop_codon:yes gene_type:complete